MKNKAKLLIVSAVSPFPTTSGGAVRIYQEIKNLSKEFDIYFIFFQQNNYILSLKERLFLENNTKKFIHFELNQQKKIDSFLNNFQPYWFSEWTNHELEIFIPKFIKDNGIKIVQIEFTQLLSLVNFIPRNVKKIFVALDISTISFKRRLFEIKNPIHFLVHFCRFVEIYIYEKYYLPKFDLVVSMSENDKTVLIEKFKIGWGLIAPNGIEKIDFLKKKVNKNFISLGYIGSFNHPPNRNAIIYFIREIAPLLERNKINFKYYLAGDNSPIEIEKVVNGSFLKNKKRVINLGKINNVKKFYKKVDLLVAPIISGSGSRIKILESLSFGVSVITTTIGAEGIRINSKHLNIANNKKDFLSQIIKFAKSKKINSSDDNLANQLKPLQWSIIMDNYANNIK